MHIHRQRQKEISTTLQVHNVGVVNQRACRYHARLDIPAEDLIKAGCERLKIRK